MTSRRYVKTFTLPRIVEKTRRENNNDISTLAFIRYLTLEKQN